MTQDATDDGSGPRRHAPDELCVLVPPAPGQSADPLPLDLRALLAEIDELRLGLSVDLGLAAAAVDAGAPDVARDVVAGTSADLAAFSVRAAHRLRSAGPPAPSVPAADVVSLPAAHPRRARRLALLAPALTAAAALVGLLVGVVPATGAAAGTAESSVATTAAASYAELWQLHEVGASAQKLARAARRLHVDVARWSSSLPTTPPPQRRPFTCSSSRSGCWRTPGTGAR